MKRKVSVAVSAMILAASLGSPLAAAEPTVQQLGEIAGFLADNDVAALRAYLELNPELLDGDTQLAILLRQFVIDSADLTTYLAFEPDLRDAFDQSGSETLPDLDTIVEEGSDPGEDPPAEVPDSDTGTNGGSDGGPGSGAGGEPGTGGGSEPDDDTIY